MARLHREMMRVLIADIATDVRHPGDRLPREGAPSMEQSSNH
jgi:DNA-binding FadR family transcriptional regulator